MIDLRSHVLDGTPCGPDSFNESLEMCRAAIAEGVRTIVATPRWEAGEVAPPLSFEECRRKLARLEVETRGSLSFKLGFALQFSPQLPDLVAQYGTNLTLAGKRHLLVSLPAVEIPVEADAVWKSLSCRDYSVVLAHPECNAVLRRDSLRLTRWVSEGMTLQIDAASILGKHGRDVQRFAFESLRKYKEHAVVASNTRWGVSLRSLLNAARQELSRKLNAPQARVFTREMPAAVIGDVTKRDSVRGDYSHGITSMIRSFRSIKALTGGF